MFVVGFVAQSLVFYVMFCRSLLFLFDVCLMITPLVSSHFSFTHVQDENKLNNIKKREGGLRQSVIIPNKNVDF